MIAMRGAWLVLLGACSFTPNGKTIDAARDTSVPIDAIDAPITSDARTCWGSGVVQICPNAAPTGTVTLSGTLDTGSAAACKPYTVPPGQLALDACVITAQSITVTGTLVVSGSRPLVLLASDTLRVSAGSLIDVSSTRSPSHTGAGGNASQCDPSGAGTTGVDSGGGAGGSFADAGGDGGDSSSSVAGGTAGAKASAIDVLRGGCPGASGGGAVGGGGGSGGGAIALLAGTSITLTGSINASGAGGNGAAGTNAGGGGGGSGGMIVLDAPLLTGAGTLIANGGGGGEGASTLGGNPGEDPSLATPLVQAQGGQGNSNAGNGGDGAAGATTKGGKGTKGSSGDGGGGGGGGAGAVLLFGTDMLTGARSP
jgi:hypothetical protein